MTASEHLNAEKEVRHLVNISNSAIHGFSPPVALILQTLYLTRRKPSQGVPINRPGAKTEEWSEEDKIFSKKLVGQTSNLQKWARFYCHRFNLSDPEDLVQETLEGAWKNRKSCTIHIQAFVKRILWLRIYDERRKKAVRQKIFSEVPKTESCLESPTPAQDWQIIISELQEKVFPFLARELRDVLILRTLGYTLKEVASIIGHHLATAQRHEIQAHEAIAHLLETMSPSVRHALSEKVADTKNIDLLSQILPHFQNPADRTNRNKPN